jgi:hypothetical protein
MMARFDISQYSTVAERIDKFWAKYPNGRLHTELIHFSPEQVVMRGEVYLDREDTRPVTSDYAEERIDSSPVNRVSMVENCATSVLGRCLADLGGDFTGAKRPSAEEMMKVQRHDENSKKRDWVTEAEKLSDVDALRLLWAEASQAGASPTVLEKVRERAEAVSSDGVLDGVAGGVPVRGKKPRS